MTLLSTALIFIGAMVIIANCFSLPIWMVDVHFSNRRSSPLAIPLIGPLALSLGLLLGGHSWWWMLLSWGADPGTVMFYLALPRLTREWWHTCSLTRENLMKGSHENQRVELTLHSTGYYLLKKHWERPATETGIVELGEVGRFTRSEGNIELRADNGWSRNLVASSVDRFVANEPGDVEDDYSIQHWTLVLE